MALLVLLLGYAFTIAARTGLADAYAEPAKSFLQSKRDAREVLTQDEWQAIYDGLNQALILAPGDPENISELGRLHRILLEADDLDADQISRYGDSATGYYQAAIAPATYLAVGLGRAGPREIRAVPGCQQHLSGRIGARG